MNTTDKKKHHTTLRLPVDVYAQLVERAKKDDRSIAWSMTNAVKEYVSKESK